MLVDALARKTFATIVDIADVRAEMAREAVCQRMWGESFDELTNRMIRDSRGERPEDGGLWLIKTGRGWEPVKPVEVVAPQVEVELLDDGCMFDETLPGSPERVELMAKHEETNKGENSPFIWTTEEITERLCTILAAQRNKKCKHLLEDLTTLS